MLLKKGIEWNKTFQDLYKIKLYEQNTSNTLEAQLTLELIGRL